MRDPPYEPPEDHHDSHPIVIRESSASTSGEIQVEQCNTDRSESTRWRKRDSAIVPSTFIGAAFTDVDDILSPIQYFKQFFDDDLFEHIANQTNLYYTQESLSKGLKVKFEPTDKAEIEQLVGALLYMGIYPNPQYRMYWNPATAVPQITRCLKGGVNRFESLKRFLHFNDNSNIPDRNGPNYDKLFKVRPIIQSILEKCQNTEPEEYHSIDEQIIPTKCKSSMKQYNPKKPHKWGYKVFTRCGSSGMVYNFEVYTGKSTNDQHVLGITGDLVMRLSENIPVNQNFKVFFDNFFTSLPLLKQLRQNGILALGTIRPNRMQGAQKIMESEKALKSKGRGSYDWRVDCSSNITVIRWQDNSTVQLASTFVNHELGRTIRRWSAKDKCYLDISCPEMVHQYNKFMGGVDLCDMLLSLYRIKLKSNKWYMPIFHYLIKLAVTNGWLMHRRHCEMLKLQNKPQKMLTLLEFQTSVACDLTMCGKLPLACVVRRGRPSSSPTPPQKRSKTTAAIAIPNNEFRFDCVGHFPEFLEKQQRCRLCPKGYTFIQCTKCHIRLCLTKERNCFVKFHFK